MQLDCDPNEAYDIISVPEDVRGPKGWLTITYKGAPIRHYAPWARHLAEQFVSNPKARRILGSSASAPSPNCALTQSLKAEPAHSMNRLYC